MNNGESGAAQTERIIEHQHGKRRKSDLQALFVDADHHPLVFALHAEANVQNSPMLLGLLEVPGPGVQRQVGQAFGQRREGKGRAGLSQDGELGGQSALRRIHHVWKSHITSCKQLHLCFVVTEN